MTKAEIRNFYREKRKQIDLTQLNKYSTLICEQVFKNFSLTNKNISLFLPIEKHKEINTFMIWSKAQELTCKVSVPKADFENHKLSHIVLESINQLTIGNYGIPEPTTGIELAAYDLDLVFVPLLAVDKDGFRVGYGKGFYDRFLSQCNENCIFIGLHLFETLEQIDDINEHDIPLHYCITPTQVIHFNNKR